MMLGDEKKKKAMNIVRICESIYICIGLCERIFVVLYILYVCWLVFVYLMKLRAQCNRGYHYYYYYWLVVVLRLFAVR